MPDHCSKLTEPRISSYIVTEGFVLLYLTVETVNEAVKRVCGERGGVETYLFKL
jgi:hypothetical protein